MFIEIKKNELDDLFLMNVMFGWVALVVGIAMFALVLSWDWIAARMFAVVNCNQGFGIGQILCILGCGLWVLTAYLFLQFNYHYWTYYGKSN